MPSVLSDSTAAQLQELIRTKRLGTFAPPPSGYSGPYLCYFVCGNYVGTVNGFRYHYGTPQLFNALTGLFENPNSESVDAAWLISEAPLEEGLPYLAVLTGARTISSNTKEGFVAVRAAGEHVRWVKITGSASGGTWPGSVQVRDAGAYIDGPTCRVKLIQGHTFQSGKLYLATHIEQGGSGPVFAAAGDVEWIYKTCDADGSNARCVKAYMHSTFAIEDPVDCPE